MIGTVKRHVLPKHASSWIGDHSESEPLPIPRSAENQERTVTLRIVPNDPLSYAARLVATLDFDSRIKDCFQRIGHVF